MYLFFDTETTGLPADFNAPISDSDNWPRCIQLSWSVYSKKGKLKQQGDFLISPDGFVVPNDVARIHGITTDKIKEKGEALDVVLNNFLEDLNGVKFIVGYHVAFNLKIVASEFYRRSINNNLFDIPVIELCRNEAAQLCRLKNGESRHYKLPTLSELSVFLFNEGLDESAECKDYVEAEARCFFELKRLKRILKD